MWRTFWTRRFALFLSAFPLSHLPQFPGLEKLEEEHISLLTERANMINTRREEDNEDDLVLIFGVPKGQQEEEVLDEFGRAVPSSSGPHSAVRERRRLARAQRASSGYETDSVLSTSTVSDFSNAISSLRLKLKNELFEDVKVKAFRDPKVGIKVRPPFTIMSLGCY